MEEITLTVEKREGRGGKKRLSELRGQSKIPAVVYGAGKPTLQVALSERELMAARSKGGGNAILRLKIGSATETVILKELQWHPVTDRPIHADFQRISLTEKIEARVPLHIVGEAPGVKLTGGLLQHELRALQVRALPADIPQAIDVDVSHLEINQQVLVKDLRAGPGLEVLEDPEHIVVHVTAAKLEVEAPAPAAAEGETQAEPELAASKGKKDEEGKPIPKAAPAAPPEKGKEAAKKEGGK